MVILHQQNMDHQDDIIPELPYDVGVECLIRIPYHHFSSVASVCKSWKHQLDLPEFWARRKAAGLARKLLVMAQAQVASNTHSISKFVSATIFRLTVFEPETGYWAELPQMDCFDGLLPMFCRVVGVGRSLVVMGGWNPVTWEVLDDVFVYDFVTDTWRRGARMPGYMRSMFGCASDCDRMVYVAGGHDYEKRALKSALAYDVVADEWTHLPDMARERDECKGAFLRGKFHVISGYATDEQGGFGTSADVFDVAGCKWLPVEEEFLPIAMRPGLCLDDGDLKFYMCDNAELVTWQGSTWQAVCKLPSGVKNTGYVTAWQGNVLVIANEGFSAPYHAYILDLKSNKWEKMEAQDQFCGYVQSGCYLEL